jgi:hypothetical protein
LAGKIIVGEGRLDPVLLVIDNEKYALFLQELQSLYGSFGLFIPPIFWKHKIAEKNWKHNLAVAANLWFQ